jgi:hypothetical protein
VWTVPRGGSEAQPAQVPSASAAPDHLLLEGVVRATTHAKQALLGPIAEGPDQASSRRELLEQGLRNLRSPGGHDDRVEGGVGAAPLGSVAEIDHDVRDAEPVEHLSRPGGEARHPLDRHHPRGQVGEDRRLVARTGSDLEHRLVALELESGRHGRDHARGRDRLPFADGQRHVLVGLGLEGVRDEPMPGHGLEGRQDPRITDPISAQTLEHAPTRQRRVRARSAPRAPTSRSPRRDRRVRHLTPA